MLRLPFVGEGGGREPDDWLIFRSGPSEFGVHPSRGPQGQEWAPAGHHELCFVVDDIDAVKAELERRGAAFSGEVTTEDFGRTAMLQVPGAGEIMLYQATHETAYDL